MKASVIGLGAMGGAMAERLLGEGMSVTVYDIRQASVERLMALGAKAATLEEIGDCDVLLTSLPSDDEVLKVLATARVLESLSGKVLIELSTILPSTMRRLAEIGAEHGVDVVDCPVSGGPREVLAGTLTLLVGAEPQAFERARPVLDALGTTHHVGVPGHGKAIKLINNTMTMGNMLLAAEAFTLGTKMGLDPQRMFDVLNQSGGRSHHFSKRMPNVLKGDFFPYFRLAMGEKDLRLALELAHEEGYVMPVASLAHQMYQVGINEGFGELDMAAVIKIYEGWAGIGKE